MEQAQLQAETGGKQGRFVKGRSGNPAGRKPGIRLATLEATVQWRELLRDLLLSTAYQVELKRRLLDGTLPPIVEAKLFAYAFGEAPKAPDDKQNGMVVNLGFLGFLQSDNVPPALLEATPPTQVGLADARAIDVVTDTKLTEAPICDATSLR